MFNLGQKTKTVKLELSKEVWERLNFQAKRSLSSPEEAAVRLLNQHLPSLTSDLARVLEQLNEKDHQLLRESFYFVMYLVSYADDVLSTKESLNIKTCFKNLESSFGTRFKEFLDLSNEECNDLVRRIKDMNSLQKLYQLKELNRVFSRLPSMFAEEYRVVLLEYAITTAAASRDSVFESERINDRERAALQLLAKELEIPILSEQAKIIIKSDAERAFNLLESS